MQASGDSALGSSTSSSSKPCLLSQALHEGVGSLDDAAAPAAAHPQSSTSGAKARPRSRHCSTNSSQSGVSFDSAIGDVYSMQTPPRAGASGSVGIVGITEPVSVVATLDFDQDLLEMTTANPNEVSNQRQAAEEPSQSSNSNNSSGPFHQQLGPPPPPPPNASSLELRGNPPPPSAPLPAPAPVPGPVPATATAPSPSSHVLPPRYHQKRRRVGTAPVINSSSSSGSSPSLPPPLPLHGAHIPYSLLHAQRLEVDDVCLDLLRRFQHACHVQPRAGSRAYISSGESDPLGVTSRLLGDALGRLRLFLFSLEPMSWLSWRDRHALYRSHLCCAAILKASAVVDLSALPAAFPLPYGEYLGEVEALHLILAHDLYNELRSVVHSVQALEVHREFPIMLLVIMVAFFTPAQAGLEQPDRVAKVHDYYVHKLQVRREGEKGLRCQVGEGFRAAGLLRTRDNLSSVSPSSGPCSCRCDTCCCLVFVCLCYSYNPRVSFEPSPSLPNNRIDFCTGNLHVDKEWSSLRAPTCSNILTAPHILLHWKATWVSHHSLRGPILELERRNEK